MEGERGVRGEEVRGEEVRRGQLEASGEGYRQAARALQQVWGRKKEQGSAMEMAVWMDGSSPGVSGREEGGMTNCRAAAESPAEEGTREEGADEEEGEWCVIDPSQVPPHDEIVKKRKETDAIQTEDLPFSYPPPHSVPPRHFPTRGNLLLKAAVGFKGEMAVVRVSSQSQAPAGLPWSIRVELVHPRGRGQPWVRGEVGQYGGGPGRDPLLCGDPQDRPGAVRTQRDGVYTRSPLLVINFIILLLVIYYIYISHLFIY